MTFSDEEIALISGGTGLVFLSVVTATLASYCLSRSRSNTVDEEREPLARSGAPSSAQTGSRPEARPPTKATFSDIQMKARMFVRGVPNYQNPSILEEINWRPDKFFLSVQKKGGSECVMTMTKVNVDNFGTDSLKSLIRQTLLSVDNPYLLPAEEVGFHGEFIVVYRPYQSKGSLKDFLFNSKPNQKYSKKYVPTGGKELNEKAIAKYGKMILEGIDHLNTLFKIQFCSCVHSGNVIMDNNGNCRLSEFENDMIGAIPKIRPVLQQHFTKDLSAVAFGAILYEMATGLEFDVKAAFRLPRSCPQPVADILNKIFKVKDSNITIRDILADPFFSSVKLYSDWEPTGIELDQKEKAVTLIQTTYNKMKEGIPPKTRRPKSTPPTNNSSGTGAVQISSAPSSKPTSTVVSPTQSPSPSPMGPLGKKKKKSSRRTQQFSSQYEILDQANPQMTPPAPPPPSARTSMMATSPTPVDNMNTGALLSSIETFKAAKLKKVQTNDRSSPKVK